MLKYLQNKEKCLPEILEADGRCDVLLTPSVPGTRMQSCRAADWFTAPLHAIWAPEPLGPKDHGHSASFQLGPRPDAMSQRPSSWWTSPGHDWPLSQNSTPKGPQGRGLGEGGWASLCDPHGGDTTSTKEARIQGQCLYPMRRQEKVPSKWCEVCGSKDLKNDRLGVGHPNPPQTSENMWVPSSWHQR